MGYFDRVEMCEIVGGFILSEFVGKYNNSFELYKDDRLGVITNTLRQVEKNQKRPLRDIKKPWIADHS